MKKIRYDVRGMSCAACVAHVEHAAAKVCGEENITVSLITNSLTVSVEDSTDESKLALQLKKALKDAGYALEDSTSGSAAKKNSIADDEFRSGLRRLIISAIITAALMVVAMGHMVPSSRFFMESQLQIFLLQPSGFTPRPGFEN